MPRLARPRRRDARAASGRARVSAAAARSVYVGRLAGRRGAPRRDSRVPVRSGWAHAGPERWSPHARRSVMAILRIPEENRTLHDEADRPLSVRPRDRVRAMEPRRPRRERRHRRRGARGVRREDRRAQSARRLRHRRCHRRQGRHAGPRRHARQVQLRALARRRRSPAHRRRTRAVSHSSRRRRARCSPSKSKPAT